LRWKQTQQNKDEYKEETGACGVHRFCYEKDYVKKSETFGRTSHPKRRGVMKKKKLIVFMMLV
jgi:hypothetical protein